MGPFHSPLEGPIRGASRSDLGLRSALLTARKCYPHLGKSRGWLGSRKRGRRVPSEPLHHGRKDFQKMFDVHRRGSTTEAQSDGGGNVSRPQSHCREHVRGQCRASGAGGASRQALGTAVFGGIIAATFLVALFVPVFFKVIQTLSERVAGGWKKADKRDTAPVLLPPAVENGQVKIKNQEAT